jgi:hypothetical protein
MSLTRRLFCASHRHIYSVSQKRCLIKRLHTGLGSTMRRVDFCTGVVVAAVGLGALWMLGTSCCSASTTYRARVSSRRSSSSAARISRCSTHQDGPVGDHGFEVPGDPWPSHGGHRCARVRRTAGPRYGCRVAHRRPRLIDLSKTRRGVRAGSSGGDRHDVLHGRLSAQHPAEKLRDPRQAADLDEGYG